MPIRGVVAERAVGGGAPADPAGHVHTGRQVQTVSDNVGAGTAIHVAIVIIAITGVADVVTAGNGAYGMEVFPGLQCGRRRAAPSRACA